MHCPSRAAGKGLLRNSVKRAGGAPCGLHWCAPPTLRWRTACGPSCVFVIKRYCCANVFLNPMVLPWLPFRPAAALQSLIPKYPGSVPSGQVKATSWAQFTTPFVLQSARTLLMWWMEWQGRLSHNHPRAMKYGHPRLGVLRMGRMKIWRATKGPYLVLNILPDEWTPGCTCVFGSSQRLFKL